MKHLIISGQARLDGGFCEHTDRDKMEFLRRIYDEGVKNIEMESLGFAANSYRAGIKSELNNRFCYLTWRNS
jgi:uridine phosphorylase